MVLLLSFTRSALVCQQLSEQSSPSQTPPLTYVASQIAQNAEKIGCRPPDCKVLITNFIFPDGKTSEFAMDLADELSKQMAAQSFSMVDRSLFVSALQRDRLSAKLQSETGTARWLAKTLDANFVILGEMSKPEEDRTELSLHFLSVSNEKASVLNLKAKLRVDTSKVDLTPTNGLAAVGAMPDTLDGQKVFGQGVPLPSCYFMPSPLLTDDARKYRFSGAVLLEGIVGVDGRLHNLRILNGAPFGLNENTLHALETWKCKPSKLNGTPVPVLVPLEVNLRLD
jgi:hypothetical protein